MGYTRENWMKLPKTERDKIKKENFKKNWASKSYKEVAKYGNSQLAKANYALRQASKAQSVLAGKRKFKFENEKKYKRIK